MIKKLKIEEKAAWSDLRSDQVCILTCESVILSRACALGRYFLGNGVTIASKDGWCVCVWSRKCLRAEGNVQRHYYERKGWLVLEGDEDLLRDRLKNVFSLL